MDQQTTITSINNILLCEYEKIKQENYQLHQQIISYSNSERSLKAKELELSEIIKTRDATISELKEENKELKKRLDKLEKENIKLETKVGEQQDTIIKLETKINEQQNTIIKLETKVEELTNDNRELKKDISIMRSNYLFGKFLVAIQDLNKENNLENNIHMMTTLREERNGEYHYINKNDNNKLKEDKIEILLNKINNMPDRVKNKFNFIYNNIIDDIIALKLNDETKLLNIDEITKQKIEYWWD